MGPTTLKFERGEDGGELQRLKNRRAMAARLRWLADGIEADLLLRRPTGIYVVIECDTEHDLVTSCGGHTTRTRIREAGNRLIRYANEAESIAAEGRQKVHRERGETATDRGPRS
jgi:hypothetical protein